MALCRELAALGKRIERPRSAVMLGRQEARKARPLMPQYEKALREAGRDDLTVADLFDESRYAERMLEKLGFGHVESMDYSAYEGARYIVDMNLPISPDYAGKFDFVLDGGTLEHIFNIPVAFRNVFEMLSVGGIFVSVAGFNGWPGHGFYQFGPDLVWSYWKHMANCEMLRCIALPRDPDKKPFPLPDNHGSAKRREYDAETPSGRVFIYYEVRKTADSRLSGSVFQPDYATTWTRRAQKELQA